MEPRHRLRRRLLAAAGALGVAAVAVFWLSGGRRLFHPYARVPVSLRARLEPDTETVYRLRGSAVFGFPSPGLLTRTRRSHLAEMSGTARMIVLPMPDDADTLLVGVLRRPNMNYLYGKPPFLWVYRADRWGRCKPRAGLDDPRAPTAVRRFLRDAEETVRLGLSGPEWLPEGPVRVGATWKIERQTRIGRTVRALAASSELDDVFRRDGRLHARVRMEYVEEIRSPLETQRPETSRRAILLDLERGVVVQEEAEGTYHETAARKPFVAQFRFSAGLASAARLPADQAESHAKRLLAMDRAIQKTAEGRLDEAAADLQALFDAEEDRPWKEGMLEAVLSVQALAKEMTQAAAEPAADP